MTEKPLRTVTRLLHIAALLVMLAACGGSGSEPVAVADDTLALPADQEILSKVYADAPQVPAGFHEDRAAQTAAPFTLYHVKTQDLDPDAATHHELCTDDIVTAIEWSDAANARRAHAGVVLSAVETNEYFEVVRTLEGLSDWVGYERVFKCAYVDRSATDLRTPGGPAGRLNRAPRSADELKTLSEYLWQFSTWNNPGHAVLASQGSGAGAALGHTLTLAALTPGAGANGCDRVTVSDWTFDLDVTSGDLLASLTEVMAFDSRHDGVTAQRCAD